LLSCEVRVHAILSFCQTIGACHARLDAHYGFFATPRNRSVAAGADFISGQLAALLCREIKAYKGCKNPALYRKRHQNSAAKPRSHRMNPAISPRKGWRMPLVYCLLLLGFGVAISGAAAHSRLVRSDPAARAVLDKAPKELKLWFNEAIEPAFAKVWIVPAQGPQIPLTTQGDKTDQRILIVTPPDSLPAGPVNIGYHVLSVDGHTVDDKLMFTIKAPE
jgi:copper resistance protein C